MKTNTIFLVSILLFLSGCSAQNKSGSLVSEKVEQEALYQKALQSLQNNHFVLEADKATLRDGFLQKVSPTTNFVLSEDNIATVQIALENGRIAHNGIGGITLKGKTSDIQLETDKKGNVTYRMMVQGVDISANVIIHLIKGTNQCSGTVSSNLHNKHFSFRGHILPSGESDLLRGRAL